MRFLEDTQCASNSNSQILMDCILNENTHFKQKMCVQKLCVSKVEDTVSSFDFCAAKCYFLLIFWTIYIFRKKYVTSESLYTNIYLKRCHLTAFLTVILFNSVCNCKSKQRHTTNMTVTVLTYGYYYMTKRSKQRLQRCCCNISRYIYSDFFF